MIKAALKYIVADLAIENLFKNISRNFDVKCNYVLGKDLELHPELLGQSVTLEMSDTRRYQLESCRGKLRCSVMEINNLRSVFYFVMVHEEELPNYNGHKIRRVTIYDGDKIYLT